MSTIIRADTDQLRTVVNQMRGAADQIGDGAGSMQQSISALDAVWSGSARDRGMEAWQRLFPRYSPAANELIRLANELEALAQRLDDAAAVFGDGVNVSGTSGAGSSSEADTKHDKPWYEDEKAEDAPQNMATLFDQLGKNNNEIQIYQVGPNEFAVLLQGSDQSLVGINSLFSDAPTSLIKDTEYAQKVRAMLEKLAADHPGAAINMVGFSLGGIIAQQVASNQSFFKANGLNLKSVSTYGCPTVGNVPQEKTHANFDAPGDIVSNLPVSLTPESTLTTLTFLKDPSQTTAIGIATHMSGYQDLPDWMPVTETRQRMLDTKPPFDTSTWALKDEYNDANTYGDTADQFLGNTLATNITNGLNSVGQGIVEQYNQATEFIGGTVDVAVGGTQTLIVNTANSINQGVESVGNVIKNPLGFLMG